MRVTIVRCLIISLRGFAGKLRPTSAKRRMSLPEEKWEEDISKVGAGYTCMQLPKMMYEEH